MWKGGSDDVCEEEDDIGRCVVGRLKDPSLWWQQNLVACLIQERSVHNNLFLFVPHTLTYTHLQRHTQSTHLDNTTTMDDMYQYASAAVNSNTPNSTNQQQGTEESDIVLQAFSNFGWGQRFSSLLDTVKKQVGRLLNIIMIR